MDKNSYIGFVIYDPTKVKSAPLGWKVIRWFQSSNYVHVFMMFEEEDGEWVYETSETIYQRISKKQRFSGTTIQLFKIKGLNYDSALGHCKKMLGIPYDYPGILGLGLFLLLQKIVNWISWPLRKVYGLDELVVKFENPLQLPQAVYCAESCLMALIAGGFKEFEGWLSNGNNVNTLHKLVALEYASLFEEI